MSAMLNMRGMTTLNKIFVCYDFKQVRDAVLVIMFSESLDSYKQKQVMLRDNGDGWNTDILKDYTDENGYKLMCEKLQCIFDQRENPDEFDGIDFNGAVRKHSNFLSRVY